MPTLPDPFDEFLRLITPLMQRRQFASKSQEVPLLATLEFACVAARHGNSWILISGRANLKINRCTTAPRFEKVVELDEIVAIEGEMPAEEVESLLVDLKHSWALRREKIRLTADRAASYSWKLPHLIKGSDGWEREFVLYGGGPLTSSLLSNSTLQEIDRQLRAGTPAFNGFDGLCGRLNLPVRRSNLRSSFQVSTVLPAVIWVVCFREDWTLEFQMWDFGSPDITVEWLPQHELQRISPDLISVADDPEVPRIVSIPVVDDTTAARLILSFGELQADVVTVPFDPLDFGASGYQELQFEREEPTVPVFATSEVPNQKPPNLKYRSELKRAIQTVIFRKRDASDLDICRDLDALDLIELPTSWRKDLKNRSFTEAYMDRTLRHKIEIEISKVRTDRRKVGIL